MGIKTVVGRKNGGMREKRDGRNTLAKCELEEQRSQPVEIGATMDYWSIFTQRPQKFRWCEVGITSRELISAW